MNKIRRDQLIAAISTLLIFLALILALILTHLELPADEGWPPKPKQEENALLFGGEFVMIGDDPHIADISKDASPSSIDVPPTSAQPRPVTSSRHESSMKVPNDSTPSPEDIEEANRLLREQESSNEIRNLVSNAFSKTGSSSGNGSGSGTGKPGQPDGNSLIGATNGSPGHTLAGRSLLSHPPIKTTYSGTVNIRVTVNPMGTVIEASYEQRGSSGEAAVKLRNNCIEKSKQLKFSKRTDGEGNQTGIVTWKFQ